MFRPSFARCAAVGFSVLLLVSVESCGSVPTPQGATPATSSGTHTVMGRAFFSGGVMVLLDAHLQDERAWGTAEYSHVTGGGDNTFRVDMDVECVGIFAEGREAIVTGPVTRVDGDRQGLVGGRDWWVVQVKEGGEEGDLILARRETEGRARTLCWDGPTEAAILRAVDGDLSIY